MFKILLSVLILLLPVLSMAANTGMTLTYSPPANWLTVGNKSYMDLELATVTAKRRISVRFFSGKTQIAEVWDDPTGDRTYNISVDLTGKAITHITGQAMAYEAGPWIASTAYSIGDKISVGDYPSLDYWWEVTRAGTTGATEPVWPNMRQFTLALSKTIAASATAQIAAGDVADNSNGTVTITLAATHSFIAGNLVTVAGTVNYDGTYTLPDQAGAADTDIIVTATYVAETFAGTETVDGYGPVDNGDGTVTITLAETHLFKTGDLITIAGTVNYNGNYTLPDQTGAADTDIIVTATYVAETFAGTETVQITGAEAVDNGDGTVNLPLLDHGYTSGQTVMITNSTNYDGNYTLAAQSNPDQVTITATYVAEPMAGASVIATPIDDPDGSGVEWTFTTGTQEYFYSEPTGRKIGRIVGDRLQLSGSKFIIRNQ